MDSASDNLLAEQLHKLCVALSPDPDGAYELAVSYLSAANPNITHQLQDEKLLCQRIYSRLISTSTKDAEKFNECFSKLKNCYVLKERVSILTLLLSLSEGLKWETTHQLFPVPVLATVKSATGLSQSSSKSTMDTPSWEGNLQKRSSAQSVSAKNSNMAMVQHMSDRVSTVEVVRSAVLAATGVRPPRAPLPLPRAALLLYERIAHLGVLHEKLREFINPESGLMPQGLMGEGLVAAIRDELTEYHRTIALLQSQALEGGGGGVAGVGGVGCTLRRVAVWALEPLHRLTWLATMAHAAHHKKGGELASCIHRFVRHGDERVESLARRLLTALTYPLLLMLTRWLLHGEIEDPFNEFFIESRSGVPIDRMWHDKYRVREWMVPSFMSRELAARILATGKSVVFMREACASGDEAMEPEHDHHRYLQPLLLPHSEYKGRTADMVGYGSSMNSVCSGGGAGEGQAWWEAGWLREGVCGAHVAVSARLLAALTSAHHLLDHLAAHRRYLLLAQGDFHHHLMTLLEEELNKPATSLYVHNLTCTLEAAVRATNAQFEPPHVLQRLQVNLFPNCDGREDTGWDVFTLQYVIDGPLGTLFPATCAARYRALFAQLWRVKRTEHALHRAWRDHTLLSKRLRNMPEVWSLMRRVSCLRLEALRLCGALQEAMYVGAEPAWEELMQAAAARRDLDDLLRLHHAALDRHSIHAMIHNTTQELQSYLGNVLNEILTLRAFETTLHCGVLSELDRRDGVAKLREQRLARGEYAFSAAEEAQDNEMRKIFLQFLANRKADLNVWARTFRTHVSTLILRLALHEEVSLQTLAFRLDYSDFYKRSDSKLHQPLTYHHKRLSEIGIDTKKKLLERNRRK